MKKSIFFWIVFIILIVVCAASTISFKIKEKQSMPVLQEIPDAYISIIAPPLSRNLESEENTKSILKNKLKDIIFYQGKYKKSDYTLIYAQYSKEVNLESAIEPIVNVFKDNSFVYESKENKINGNEGIYIDGTFEKDGIKFGLKEQLIKHETGFWQILTIFPYSEKNIPAAEEFINSISLDQSLHITDKNN